MRSEDTAILEKVKFMVPILRDMMQTDIAVGLFDTEKCGRNLKTIAHEYRSDSASDGGGSASERDGAKIGCDGAKNVRSFGLGSQTHLINFP